MDSAGLGIFTVAGIRIAYQHAARPTLFLLVFVGVVTGVGGGLLRDMMAGDPPYIFVKHVYASASLAGALACVWLWPLAGEMAAMLDRLRPGHRHPHPLRPLPVEPAPCPRLKHRGPLQGPLSG
ncbi:MAG: TRIC cation channel family protein [Dysosmobacter sp.]